ncbi:MAG: hypothetical protein HGA76_08015, partial [Candidatus Firestonebacteria bacterium]|nr:hypothetical protein [Candidatus Firestonebacteria bacterium]
MEFLKKFLLKQTAWFQAGNLFSLWHHRRMKNITRLISLVLSITFILPYLAFAFEGQTFHLNELTVNLRGQSLEIPANLGTIVKAHPGQGRTIVYIQDLHCNAEVQNNIAGIIDHLAGRHGVKVIGVEGAAQQVDVSALGSFPVAEVKHDVGQYFIRQGQVTGAEYYAATGVHPVRLEGIEDPGLYQANHDSMHKFLTDESQGYIYDLRAILENQKTRVYGEALKAHDKHRAMFREGKEALLKYALYLASALRQAGLGLEPFPQLAGYVSAHRDGFGSKVNPDDLYLEMERADALLREGLYVNADERTLNALETKLDIMEKLLNISATPEELAAYRRAPESYRIAEFMRFFQAYAAPEDPEPDSEIYGLDELVKETENFYRVADTRSRVFVDQMVQRLQASREDAGVLITGGYHTSDVLAELERRGIGYISVRPRLTQVDLVNPYFSLIKGKRTPLEKLLAQNQNILSPQTKFSEVGEKAGDEVATFAGVLDFAAKEVLVAIFVEQGHRSLSGLRSWFEAKMPTRDSGPARLDWESARGNEAAGIFLLPAEVGGQKAVGLIRPRLSQTKGIKNSGIIPLGKKSELVVLDPRLAEREAAALLQKSSAQLNLSSEAVKDIILKVSWAAVLTKAGVPVTFLQAAAAWVKTLSTQGRKLVAALGAGAAGLSQPVSEEVKFRLAPLVVLLFTTGFVTITWPFVAVGAALTARMFLERHEQWETWNIWQKALAALVTAIIAGLFY